MDIGVVKAPHQRQAPGVRRASVQVVDRFALVPRYATHSARTDFRVKLLGLDEYPPTPSESLNGNFSVVHHLHPHERFFTLNRNLRFTTCHLTGRSHAPHVQTGRSAICGSCIEQFSHGPAGARRKAESSSFGYQYGDQVARLGVPINRTRALVRSAHFCQSRDVIRRVVGGTDELTIWP